jgi:hypothetical protein
MTKKKTTTFEVTEEIKEELTKNQIARLFTVRVCKHFNQYAEMDKEDFWKYMKEANDELKDYMAKEDGENKK